MLRTILEDMHHPQPATPIQTDNACAAGICNDTVKQRRSKAMDIASAKAISLSIGARAPRILQTTTRNTTLPHTIASNADNTSSSYTQQPNVRSQLVFTVSPLTASPSRTILHTHYPINFALLRNFGNSTRAHTPRRKFLHMYCKGVLILDLRVPYRHNTSVTYIEHMTRQ